jgi:hypothetical protein
MRSARAQRALLQCVWKSAQRGSLEVALKFLKNDSNDASLEKKFVQEASACAAAANVCNARP